MTISTNYSSPVTVNGFSCRNCAEVTDATRHIDPAHPKSGPNNVDAANDPSQPPAIRQKFKQAHEILTAAFSPDGAYSAAGKSVPQVGSGAILDLRA